jgi:hypothetical protein
MQSPLELLADPFSRPYSRDTETRLEMSAEGAALIQVQIKINRWMASCSRADQIAALEPH